MSSDQRVDVAEALVAVLKQLFSRLGQQRLQVPVQSLVKRACRGVVIEVRPAFRLSNDLLHDTPARRLSDTLGLDGYSVSHVRLHAHLLGRDSN